MMTLSRFKQLSCCLVLASLSACAMAVDRSKFRTCGQTSFCRRHRGQHSAILYNYKLDKDSVHFHVPSHGNEAAISKDNKDQKGGLWNSLSRRIYGSSENEIDPYIRGPEPTLTGTLVNTVPAPETSTNQKEKLQWSLYALNDGLLRMRVTEFYSNEHASPYSKARVTYDELVLEAENLSPAHHAEWIRSDTKEEKFVALLDKVIPEGDDKQNYMALQYGDSEEDTMVLLVRLETFAVYLYRENNIQAGPILALGASDMMHFEIRRRHPDEEAFEDEEEDADFDAQEEPKEEKEIVGYWEDGLAIYADGTREEKKVVEEDHRKLTEEEKAQLDREGLWEEKFQSHHDSKPNGPMSVGMDVQFPSSRHIFGLPEHASSTQLKATIGEGSHYQEPYRLYNLDVFEYELDETMALYGHVPLIVSHSEKTGTSGIFWHNPTETYVDVIDGATDNDGTLTHWISESGIIDVFLLPGSSSEQFYHQYSLLTGKMPLPPMFSLGYHQCRWNYKDEQDVYQVHDKFEELDYPYDVLWLDIEHTDGKRYFTWDNNLFPNPEEMQSKLWSQGRRMVTIIDPHIKRDDNYYVHKQATSSGVYIKDSKGEKDYDGWCWPGSSSYLDFTSERVRNWWADQFSYDRYKGSTPSLFTWNDMNEPSVFNGPEVSMQKDLLNLNGEEHREWHNLYGMLFHRATGEGQIKRSLDENIRPFVLSRAFFAGSQKYGAIWTGDNAAEWSHLEVAAPMLLSLNTGALSFVGADVGGFFGNPDAELMTRWNQAGAYQPFFRGHAHHDSKRREPWMFGEETMHRLRNAAMARYALLPFWYTVFHEAGVTGMPVMRMMWMQYPNTVELFATDDQYLIGSDLLVKPVTGAGVTETTVSFPTTDNWYDVDTLEKMPAEGAIDGVAAVTVASDLDKIPVYQRGGSIITRKLRLRRSARLMMGDPYTLYIALNKAGEATGTLYMDDEETFAHQRKDEFGEAHFSANLSNAGTITNRATVGAGWTENVAGLADQRTIERIVVMGISKAPAKISVGESNIEFNFNESSNVLVIRKPGISALSDWDMILSMD